MRWSEIRGSCVEILIRCIIQDSLYSEISLRCQAALAIDTGKSGDGRRSVRMSIDKRSAVPDDVV
jgi:hypothetical protein